MESFGKKKKNLSRSDQGGLHKSLGHRHKGAQAWVWEIIILAISVWKNMTYILKCILCFYLRPYLGRYKATHKQLSACISTNMSAEERQPTTPRKLQVIVMYTRRTSTQSHHIANLSSTTYHLSKGLRSRLLCIHAGSHVWITLPRLLNLSGKRPVTLPRLILNTSMKHGPSHQGVSEFEPCLFAHPFSPRIMMSFYLTSIHTLCTSILKLY